MDRQRSAVARRLLIRYRDEAELDESKAAGACSGVIFAVQPDDCPDSGVCSVLIILDPPCNLITDASYRSKEIRGFSKYIQTVFAEKIREGAGRLQGSAGACSVSYNVL